MSIRKYLLFVFLCTCCGAHKITAPQNFLIPLFADVQHLTDRVQLSGVLVNKFRDDLCPH